VTDDEILDAHHKARLAHEAGKVCPDATDETYFETYAAAAAAEKALADRFGLGEGWKRYRAKYPNSN
jgi:hypothetical protein